MPTDGHSKALASSVGRGFASVVIVGLLSLLVVEGQQPVSVPAVGIPGVPWAATRDTSTNLPVKDLGGGRWQLGRVLLDQKDRSISFPSVVNMNGSVVEYLLVAQGGKTHESVLRTEARPFDIHVAMLLLGARAATTSNPAIFYDPELPVPGDRIDIELKWRDDEKTVTKAADEWIYNTATKRPMSTGPWAYNGSQFVDGEFVAQKEGSIVSVMTDPYALVNNPRAGRENDEIWQVNTNAVPPLGTEVDVRIRLKEGR